MKQEQILAHWTPQNKQQLQPEWKERFNMSSVVLITGGAGSLGYELTKQYLIAGYQVRVYSRDEYKHWDLINKLSADEDFRNQFTPITAEFRDFVRMPFLPREMFGYLRLLIGDVRDAGRLNRALEGVDIVIHTAALKQIESGEYNPQEVVKTNIDGTQNVVDACINNNVRYACLVSSDKAVNPSNLYGASKYMQEKLWLAGNNLKGSREMTFYGARFGNLRGSKGSVWELFEKQKETGIFTITDEKMTRFDYSLKDASEFIIKREGTGVKPTIYIPKMKWYSIMDLPKLYHPNPKIEIIGLRSGEKLFEELVGEFEPVIEFDTHYKLGGDKYQSIRSGIDLDTKITPTLE